MSTLSYIAVMALTTYLIRMLPLTAFRKPIRSRFFRSFLHYVPYACLTAMTFPAILSDTAAGTAPGGLTGMLPGAAALAVAVYLAARKQSLLVVALAASAAVFLTERLMGLPI